MPVGKSKRTPFKHWILDNELGRLAGVLGLKRVYFPCQQPLNIIDLCAGDGINGDHGVCSPFIIEKHAKFLIDQHVPVNRVFIERDRRAFETLKMNIKLPYSSVLNMDARDYRFHGSKNSCVFVNCDPNHFNELPMSDGFMDSLPEYTTFIITMGCNVGGLKRLSEHERHRWYEFKNNIQSRLVESHDLLLISVIGDAAQWAYMLRIPMSWVNKTRNSISRKGKLQTKRGVNTYSWRKESRDFEKAIDRLFLTKSERGYSNA